MTTLNGEVKTPASKGAFFTSFVFQAALIGLMLTVGIVGVPQLNIQPLTIATPVILRPYHQDPIPQNNNPQTGHRGGGGPSIPTSSVPRIYRTFVAPHDVPKFIDNSIPFTDTPPGVTDVVYGRYSGNGSGTGTGPGTGIDIPGLDIGSSTPPAPVPPVITRITQGGVVQESKCIYRPNPLYPAMARNTRISGVVVLDAIIGKDGVIQQLHARSGHPMLIPAAMDAVKTWRYSPTLLNHMPVEVQTTIEVRFKLDQQL